MNKSISSKELIHMHVHPIKTLDLPSKKGLIPTNSPEEKATTAEGLQLMKKFLEQTRVDRKNTRSEAVWLPEKRLSKLTRKAGKSHQNFGFTENSETYLTPDESLYLIETNQLELLWNGVPFSIEQAYTVLLEDKDCFEKYRAFKKLAGLGYRIKEPKITNNRRTEAEIDKKRCKLSDDSDEELFERLKAEGPKTTNICEDYSAVFNVYLPKSSIKTCKPHIEVIKKPESKEFSHLGASGNNSSTVTSFTEEESVCFYQFHEVDLSNS